MRINAGNLSSDHWVNDQSVGGGRIVGEVCHFIDLAYFIAGDKISTVYADIMPSPHNLLNTLVISLSFANGSIASISYFSNGNKKVSKEWIEVFCDGTVLQIDDFRKTLIFSDKTKIINYKKQDKGHKTEISEFINSVRNGTECPIPFNESYHTSLATFKVLDSIKTKKVINL